MIVLENARDAACPETQSTVESWLETDDVFNKDFLQHVYFLFLPKTDTFDLDELNILTLSVPEDWNNRSIQAGATNTSGHQVSYRGGPYFASDAGIRQAWRLFDDTNEAFQFPVVPDEHGEDKYVFTPLPQQHEASSAFDSADSLSLGTTSLEQLRFQSLVVAITTSLPTPNLYLA